MSLNQTIVTILKGVLKRVLSLDKSMSQFQTGKLILVMGGIQELILPLKMDLEPLKEAITSHN